MKLQQQQQQQNLRRENEWTTWDYWIPDLVTSSHLPLEIEDMTRLCTVTFRLLRGTNHQATHHHDYCSGQLSKGAATGKIAGNRRQCTDLSCSFAGSMCQGEMKSFESAKEAELLSQTQVQTMQLHLGLSKPSATDQGLRALFIVIMACEQVATELSSRMNVFIWYRKLMLQQGCFLCVFDGMSDLVFFGSGGGRDLTYCIFLVISNIVLEITLLPRIWLHSNVLYSTVPQPLLWTLDRVWAWTYQNCHLGSGIHCDRFY